MLQRIFSCFQLNIKIFEFVVISLVHIVVSKLLLMFPSDVLHHVKEQLLDEERITIAFNVISKNKVENKSILQYQ